MRVSPATCMFAGLIAALASSSTGCAQVFGIDTYTLGDEPAQPPPVTDSAFEPAPYLTAPACATCLASSCQAENAACNADEFCTSFMERAHGLDPQTEPAVADLDLQARWDVGEWDAAHGQQDDVR